MTESRPFDAHRARTFIAETPIAGWLGLSLQGERETRLYHLTFNETHIGNPLIRALHGGVISAFLECAMQAEIAGLVTGDFRGVSFDIHFLTSSKADDMTARVTVHRVGRRLAFLSAVGWQSDETRPVAMARACLRVSANAEAGVE